MEVAAMKRLMQVLLMFGLLTTTQGSTVMETIEKKNAQMLYTGVAIGTDTGSSGSGVIVGSSAEATVILTARHVVQGAQLLTAVIFPDETEHTATIIKLSQKYDLALIAIDVGHPYVALLSDGPTPVVYQEVFKVGAGAGSDPHPGTGIISSYDDELMMVDTGVTYGDSGGGIWVDEDGEYKLIGTIVMVGTIGQGVPIYHQGLALNREVLFDFLSHD